MLDIRGNPTETGFCHLPSEGGHSTPGVYICLITAPDFSCDSFKPKKKP
jgi:hypothetical protein